MKSVEIIMLPVADRQKAKEFYLKLGFKVIVEAPAAHGETWIQMGFPVGNFHLTCRFSGCHLRNRKALRQLLKNLRTKALK